MEYSHTQTQSCVSVLSDFEKTGRTNHITLEIFSRLNFTLY